MITSSQNVANVFGGKTARACDSCIKKRARWYCAADDAFLCQSCDSSVHSANPLARGHERVRLKTASLNLKSLAILSKEPSWLHGFTRKARTPRHGKPLSLSHFKVEEKFKKFVSTIMPFVPDLGSDDQISVEDNNEEEQQLLFRVPIFSPPPTRMESRDFFPTNGGFLPSEMDLEDFAADVESLLGRGLENESFKMEELGLLQFNKEEFNNEMEAKKEEIDEIAMDEEVVEEEEPPFELSFEYDSATCGEEERDLKNEDESEKMKKRRKLLSLDYEAVITAWATQGCPWTTGNRPEFDPNDQCWPQSMGNWGGEQVEHGYGEIRRRGDYPVMGGGGGGGREARVSRYREKRRRRLFSKKIRYQVRKLNAEKRPRIKGRFVKRAPTLH